MVREPWESVRTCWLKPLKVGMKVRTEGYCHTGLTSKILEIVKIEPSKENFMDGMVSYKEISPIKRRKPQTCRFWWIYRETTRVKQE